eukprot:gnl/TRDRNA2_/TRDRNA2_191651_c0_seq1.p1 gnl/TRDRNA2_/TRDRNA2_191651_c0~~gnl/TRDRNA2_/TRDRNA2_191651_c0_seq1.p1  ORF type:complete len:257 (-),score=75.55 gnl/TRDRNA2_/TRDRNA2_191651_c0_seq1:72-842(-)
MGAQLQVVQKQSLAACCTSQTEPSSEGDVKPILHPDEPGPTIEQMKVENVLQPVKSVKEEPKATKPSGPTPEEIAAKKRKSASSAASKVRARLAEGDVAWAKVGEEYNVQKMIWESASLVRGSRNQGTVTYLKDKIENALALAAENRLEAVEGLEVALHRSKKENNFMSKSMFEAAQNAILLESLAAPRKKLAERLEDAAAGKSSPPTPPPDCHPAFGGGTEDVETLISACQFFDSKLEKSVRNALAPLNCSAAGA